MRRVLAWGVVVALGFGVQGIARAQPQDDAALADEPEKRAWRLSGRGASTSERPGAATEQAAEPAMTTAQLRQSYPDLELRVTPPPRLTLLLTSIYPLQTLGIGLGTDIYALPRLRLSAIVAVGGSLGGGVNEQWELSLYSEVGIGVAVLRWPGQAVAKLPGPAAFRFRSKRGTAERLILGEERPPDELFVHATVPASHSLEVEVEVGAFSGHYLLRGYRSDGRVPSQPR